MLVGDVILSETDSYNLKSQKLLLETQYWHLNTNLN